MGQATTVSGTPVSTPGTNPATVGDRPDRRQHRGRVVAKEIGVTPSRVRNGVTLTRPTGAGRLGGQPADGHHDHVQGREPRHRPRGRQRLRPGRPRAGARGLLDVIDTYETAVATAQAERDRLEAEIAALPPPARRGRRAATAACRSSRSSASTGQQLQIATTELSDQQLNLVKESQFQPVHRLAGDEPELVRERCRTGRATVRPRRRHRLPRRRDRHLRLAREPGRPCGARVGRPPPSRRASRSRRPDAGEAGTAGTTPADARESPPAGTRSRCAWSTGTRGAPVAGRPGDRRSAGAPRSPARVVRRARAGRAARRTRATSRPGAARARRRGAHRRGAARGRGALRPRPPEPRVRRRARRAPATSPRSGSAPPRGRPRVELREPHAARVPAGRPRRPGGGRAPTPAASTRSTATPGELQLGAPPARARSPRRPRSPATRCS